VHDAVDALLGRQLEDGREDLDGAVDLAARDLGDGEVSPAAGRVAERPVPVQRV
jgi:hypothetical protein